MAKKKRLATAGEVEAFIAMYVSYKKRYNERAGGVKRLSETDSRNLAILFDAGYLMDEFSRVMEQMFFNETYANDNGLSMTPTHVLRPDNFDRYLAKHEAQRLKAEAVKAEEAEQREAQSNIDPKGVINQAVAKQVEYLPEDVEEAKLQYSKSLVSGVWDGTVLQATMIGKEFTNAFTKEEKTAFFTDAIAYKQPERKAGTISEALDRVMRTDTMQVMFELVVKEAVKRKIVEPWKEQI